MPATWIELPIDADRWNAFRLDKIVSVIDNEGLHEEGDLTFCCRVVISSGFDSIDGYIAARATDVVAFLVRAEESNLSLLRYDGPRTLATDAVVSLRDALL